MLTNMEYGRWHDGKQKDLNGAFQIRSVVYWSSSNLLINFQSEMEMMLRVLTEPSSSIRIELLLNQTFIPI